MVRASNDALGNGRCRPSHDEQIARALGLRLLEHGQAEVGADGRLGVGAVALQREQHVAAAGGEIEHARGLLRGDGAGETPAPVDVEPTAP